MEMLTWKQDWKRAVFTYVIRTSANLLSHVCDRGNVVTRKHGRVFSPYKYEQLLYSVGFGAGTLPQNKNAASNKEVFAEKSGLS